MPQVVGAIDGVQIEVIGLCNDSKVDYFNSKQLCFRSLLKPTWFSFTLQQTSQEAFMTLVSYETQLCIEILNKGEY